MQHSFVELYGGVEILLNNRRKEECDIELPLYCKFFGRLDSQGIQADDASHVGLVHEEQEVVEMLRMQIDMLEQFMGVDCAGDVRRVRVCRAGWSGSGENNSAEICIDYVGSQPLELRQKLDEGLAHETMDKSMDTGIIHLRCAGANPTPEVIERLVHTRAFLNISGTTVVEEPERRSFLVPPGTYSLDPCRIIDGWIGQLSRKDVLFRFQRSFTILLRHDSEASSTGITEILNIPWPSLLGLERLHDLEEIGYFVLLELADSTGYTPMEQIWMPNSWYWVRNLLHHR
ncbi:hypothetical protein DFH07DRAFT_782549 [Mycena maculata]|uniref:Uncharacterized protein n=1 Tax=Mycena maculata TaxID=230809 RepID=A0AAD7HSA0_9AGAR|nr:hypothetical protein DFH07DRAFT_782594 [Mycena maculata]KAJ7727119.1 hypothetical protein DFH07DRAFT_782549 [Mycena maculata]